MPVAMLQHVTRDHIIRGVDIMLIYTIVYLGLGLISSVAIYAMTLPMTKKTSDEIDSPKNTRVTES